MILGGLYVFVVACCKHQVGPRYGLFDLLPALLLRTTISPDGVIINHCSSNLCVSHEYSAHRLLSLRGIWHWKCPSRSRLPIEEGF